jgi:DNA-binding response OmpR family regulator
MTHNVLIVDDCANTLSALSEVLESEGFTTLIALDGLSAIKIAHKLEPDIIVLDGVMPGLNGFETCEKIKSDPDLEHIPVIFMTGLTEPDDIVRGLNAGGVDYVKKPVVHAELIARLRTHLASAKLTQSTKVALDHAGQFILCLDSNCELKWMTPQVKKLVLKDDDNTRLLLIQEQVKSWIEHTNPDTGAEFSIKLGNSSFRLTLIGSSEDQEILFKIHDDNQDAKIKILRQELKLTNKEAEVLLWLTVAKTNREIAQILGSSPGTVNKHTENIFKKLDTQNRTAAAGKAIRVLTTWL